MPAAIALARVRVHDTGFRRIAMPFFIIYTWPGLRSSIDSGACPVLPTTRTA